MKSLPHDTGIQELILREGGELVRRKWAKRALHIGTIGVPWGRAFNLKNG